MSRPSKKATATRFERKQTRKILDSESRGVLVFMRHPGFEPVGRAQSHLASETRKESYSRGRGGDQER